MESAALMKRVSCSAALLLLALSLSSSVALATPLLPANTDAYQYPTWSGTVGFSVSGNGSTLSGTIDYAVFLASDFNKPANYGANPQPGPVVYAYQIFVTGDDASHLSLTFPPLPLYPAPTNISAFPSPLSATPSGPGTAPTSMSADDQSADWFFDTTIKSGEHSEILVFSSPYAPQLSGWTLTDNGLQYSAPMSPGFGLPVPNPSNPIPEPATLTLLGTAGLFGILMVRRFRGR